MTVPQGTCIVSLKDLLSRKISLGDQALSSWGMVTFVQVLSHSSICGDCLLISMELVRILSYLVVPYCIYSFLSNFRGQWLFSSFLVTWENSVRCELVRQYNKGNHATPWASK